MSLQVPLDHLVGGAVKGPDGIAGADIEQVEARRTGVDFPFVEVLAIFVEDLNAVIIAVVHENVTRLLIDSDPVHVAEVTGTRFHGLIIAASRSALLDL